MKVLHVLGVVGRKVRNGWRLVTGADELEPAPRDPNEPPGGNAGGNIAGLGGNLHY